MSDSSKPRGTQLRILIVRLGSLGDIVHALPVAAALRLAFPDARIDWLVDARHLDLLEMVPVLDGRHAIATGSPGSVVRRIAGLRRIRYDVALDLQGLLKSAVLARASGARRVIGFPATQLREPAARVFYTETAGTPAAHVVQKNLSMLRALGLERWDVAFPLDPPASAIVPAVRQQLGIHDGERFALINPGAAWPNKRWLPVRFGEVTMALRDRHRLRSLVLWGPGEEALARDVVSASGGAAEMSPRTTVSDLVTLARAAALMVSGDTGPLHLAAAVAIPLVGIYGPTHPDRNGPWAPDDVTVSRYSSCRCHHRRRCHAERWCLLDATAAEVVELVDMRLARLAARA